MSDRYAAYNKLDIDYPAERVLRITFNRPETYNSVDVESHTQITKIWKDIDEDVVGAHHHDVMGRQSSGSAYAQSGLRSDKGLRVRRIERTPSRMNQDDVARIDVPLLPAVFHRD